MRWVCALAVIALPALAHADAPTNESKPAPQQAKRSRPDYGRPPARSFARSLLWIPRLTLYPLYALWNYGVRAPLGWLTSKAEREHWPTQILDFFTFGPDRSAGIVPTAMLDFGIRPSVGVFTFWNHALHPNNELTFRFGTWGPNWLHIDAGDQFRIGPDSKIGLDLA